jgi:hypothetical protein
LAAQAKALLDVISFFKVENNNRQTGSRSKFRSDSNASRSMSFGNGVGRKQPQKNLALTSKTSSGSDLEDFSEF